MDKHIYIYIYINICVCVSVNKRMKIIRNTKKKFVENNNDDEINKYIVQYAWFKIISNELLINYMII